MEFYKQSIEESLNYFSSNKNGLSYSEVNSRVKESCEFAIKKAKKSNLFIKFLAQLKELMVLILLISAIISIIIGIVENSTS